MRLQKDSPTASDVHVPGPNISGGAKGKKKAKPFSALVPLGLPVAKRLRKIDVSHAPAGPGGGQFAGATPSASYAASTQASVSAMSNAYTSVGFASGKSGATVKHRRKLGLHLKALKHPKNSVSAIHHLRAAKVAHAKMMTSHRTDQRKMKKPRKTTKAASFIEKIAERQDTSPASGESKYGDVTYADAKNKKYPIDTAARVRAAWSYINQGKNAGEYSATDVATIKDKIRAAGKRFGISFAAKSFIEVLKTTTSFDPIPSQEESEEPVDDDSDDQALLTVTPEDFQTDGDDGDEDEAEGGIVGTGFTPQGLQLQNDVANTRKHFEAVLPFEVVKLDQEQQLVYGWASVTKVNGRDVIDLQGDVIDIYDLQKAAHQFMAESRDGSDMHGQRGVASIVESMIIDEAIKQSLGITTPNEGWFICQKIHDPSVWAGWKAGRYTGFSIGGSGVRTAMTE